jgi:hypothetical protein
MDASPEYGIIRAMRPNATKRKSFDAAAAVLDDDITDAKIDRNLAARRDEINVQLEEAQASIARGEATPLEPLSVLLRDARHYAKTVR